jgi:hypothetical protein
VLDSSAAARLTLPDTVSVALEKLPPTWGRAARASGGRGARRLRGVDVPGHTEGLTVPNAALPDRSQRPTPHGRQAARSKHDRPAGTRNWTTDSATSAAA